MTGWVFSLTTEHLTKEAGPHHAAADPIAVAKINQLKYAEFCHRNNY